MQKLLLSMLTALLGLSAPAQTFVVDAQNGPGTNFTDLPAAVAAVPDGAILLVRPGTYGWVLLDGKGMSILATAPQVTVGGFFLAAPVLVRNLAPGQSVTLRGITVSDTGGSNDRMTLTNCAGPVLLENVTYLSTPSFSTSLFPRAIFADGCDAVTVRDSTLRGYYGIHGRNSVIAVENCVLDGNAAFNIAHTGSVAGRGLVVEGGRVTVSRCRVTGGAGLLFPGGTFQAEPAPAVALFGGILRLCEDGSGSYLAGQLTGGAATPAIGGTSGVVIRDPSPTLTGSNGGPAVAATLVDIVRPLPSLRTISAPPGGTVTADVTTPLGEVVLLGISLPGPPAAVPGIDGLIWLHPAWSILVALGTPQPGAPVSHAIAVPNNPALVAARFTWQAVAWSAAEGLRASNPSSYSH